MREVANDNRLAAIVCIKWTRGLRAKENSTRAESTVATLVRTENIGLNNYLPMSRAGTRVTEARLRLRLATTYPKAHHPVSIKPEGCPSVNSADGKTYACAQGAAFTYTLCGWAPANRDGWMLDLVRYRERCVGCEGMGGEVSSGGLGM
jgi:hypothetical protein